jgi:hypothetical protein
MRGAASGSEQAKEDVLNGVSGAVTPRVALPPNEEAKLLEHRRPSPTAVSNPLEKALFDIEHHPLPTLLCAVLDMHLGKRPSSRKKKTASRSRRS